MNTDIIYPYLIIFLIAVIFVQQVYWNYQTHRFLDKFMCRNYGEYIQLTKPAVSLGAKADPDAVSEEQVLSELNSLIG